MSDEQRQRDADIDDEEKRFDQYDELDEIRNVTPTRRPQLYRTDLERAEIGSRLTLQVRAANALAIRRACLRNVRRQLFN